MNTERLFSIFKKNFGTPKVMTWGYVLMFFTVLTAAFYAVRCFLKSPDLPIPLTSLTGCSLFTILESLCVLVLPAVLLSGDFGDRIPGRFTGAGALILALISGIPLMMIRIPLYNAVVWFNLRVAGKSVFPVIFHAGAGSLRAGVLGILSDTVIPSFAASLFFFGLLWSRFKREDRRKAAVIITLAFVFFTMDLTSALASAAAAVWCCYLRSRIHNMWAPFLCLISMTLSERILPSVLSRIDIFDVQTVSDISLTYFYSSLPAFFMGLVLLLFFIRVLDSFSNSLRFEIDDTEYDSTIPLFDKSINLSLILTLAIAITIWILIIRGAHI